MTSRRYTEKVQLPDWSWPITKAVWGFLAVRIDVPSHETYRARIPNAEVEAPSFSEIVEDLEGEQVIELSLSRNDAELDIFYYYWSGSDVHLVTIQGSDQDRVVGTAETLRRTISRWQNDGYPEFANSARSIEEPDPMVPASADHRFPEPVERQSLVRRLVHQPNPWVLYIVGGLITIVVGGWLLAVCGG